MRLEHPPRITGSPSTTKTTSVCNVLSQLQIYNQTTTIAHFISSSSTYYFINDVCKNDTHSGRNHHTVLKVLHTGKTGLFDTYDEYIYYEKCHVQIRSTAFNVTQSEYANRHILQRIYRCNIHTQHTSVQRNYEQVVQYELSDGELCYETSLVNNTTESSIPINVLGNTAFNHSTYEKIQQVESFSSLHLKNETTLCFDLLGDTIIKTDCTERRRPRHRTNRLQDSTITTSKLNNLSLAKDDAWMEETIRKRSTLHFGKYKKHQIDEYSCGKFNRKNYGLLFLLYLLAMPLLCSTYPSTGIIASVSFVQKSSLVHTDNITVRNLSPVARLRSSGSRINAQLHKEHLQSREQVHPYNEYTWEVNQINPWLSACDLAGPAPADLQGSCGPPEVPKYCPISCSSSINADRIFHEVVERLVVPKKWRTGSAAKIQWKTVGNTVKGSTAPDQCLFYLEESHKRDICRKDFAQSSLLSFSTSRENRYWFLSGLRLRHCCEHAVINALAPGDGGPLEDVLNGSPRCINALEKILSVDALAARLHCEFEEVLARYDCRQSYSVIHNCTHCKEAYRKWVCSSLVPYFAHEGPSISLNSVEVYVGMRLRPCRSFCQSVEQRCPYLLPGDRAPAYPTQYAGEPTFLCRDPNIPETGGQAVRALHGDEEEECCFRVCSEDEPGSGVCTSCAENEPHRRRTGRDPPSAPHCEITSSVQSDFADLQNSAESSLGLSLPASPSTTSASSSFCVSGGTDSISSSSSSSSSNTIPPVPVSLLCLLWIWVALISLCQVAFPWSPALDAGFVCKKSSWLTTSGNSTVNKLKVIERNSSSTILTAFTRSAQQLPRVMFYTLVWALFSCCQGYWYHWWWFVYRFTSKICCQTFKLSHVQKHMNLREQDVHHCNENRPSFPFDTWHCCRHNPSTRKKARIRGGRLKRRRRRRFWFSPWKWKGPF